MERKELQLEHRFAILPSRQQTLYQLCDIDDTRIQKLVQAPDAFTTTCNVRALPSSPRSPTPSFLKATLCGVYDRIVC